MERASGDPCGARVYLSNGNVGQVQCLHEPRPACPNFPKVLTDAGYTYTVNTDSQRLRPALWVNSN